MNFPKSFFCIGVVAGVLSLAGCSSPRLADGCYQSADRADGGFACVYDDIIFLRVKMPASAPSTYGFFDWAGNYSLDDEGGIDLKMDSESKRNFKFYFGLQRQNGGILVNDYGSDRKYFFSHEKNNGGAGNFRPVDK
ncbi:MAG: hypothetical protein MJ016_04025 [Victivallaceae bacterium]|nr:hypothetical protein [Victivallaceae bacterium]